MLRMFYRSWRSTEVVAKAAAPANAVKSSDESEADDIKKLRAAQFERLSLGFRLFSRHSVLNFL